MDRDEEGVLVRAFTLDSFDQPPALRDIPTPEPSPDEVLIRVRASGVNGFDVALANRMTEGWPSLCRTDRVRGRVESRE
jgi:NADPH:quinone reductase-like Zn-dependent oxidoreductase